MQTRSSPVRPPLYSRLGVIQIRSGSAPRALTLPPVGVRSPIEKSSLVIWTISSLASASVRIARSAPAAQHAARAFLPRDAALDQRRAVDEDPLDALGALEEPALATGQVVHHLRRAGRHSHRVEEDEVGRVTLGQPAATGETIAGGGNAGQEADRLL